MVVFEQSLAQWQPVHISSHLPQTACSLILFLLQVMKNAHFRTGRLKQKAKELELPDHVFLDMIPSLNTRS